MLKFIKKHWDKYQKRKQRDRVIAKSKVKAQLEELENSMEELRISHANFKKYTDRISSISPNQEGSEMFDEFID